MGLFDFFKGPDFNEGIETYKNTKDAVLQEIQKVERLIDKAAPLFVYCLSGARSRMAVAQLQQMGYAKVTNLGGINSYRGKVER